MIRVIREEGTDYLFAGFLEREFAKHSTSIDTTLCIEPKKGTDFYFCQDYEFSVKELPCKFAFYALPSWREYHEKMMNGNCQLVTYAADPEFHKPLPVPKKYDIGFIGRRYYKERRDFLDAAVTYFGGSFLNLDTCPNIEIPQRLSECKVLLNHTRREIDINLRFFEEMALGCQVMMRTPYLDEFATDGVHYMGYSSNEEMVDVVKKLLADEDLRNKITYNARKHFLSHHTYAHRVATILNSMADYFERTKV